MSLVNNNAQFQSSPSSFHTVQEFRTPSPIPSLSEFEGFSDNDNWPHHTSTSELPASPTPPSTAPPSTALLTPPPTCNPDGSIKTFTSLEAALSYCQSWALDHGYAVRRYRTAFRGKEKTLYKVYIECECAGTKQGTKVPDQYRVRKDQASKACGCPFRGSIAEKDGFWSIRINHSDHDNHLPLLQPADSAIHRRAARIAHPELR